MKVKILMKKLEAQKARSKWQKGVKTLAFMLIEGYMCNSTGDSTEENTDIYNAFEWLDYPVDDDLYKRFRNKNDARFYACKQSVEGCQFLCATDDICQLLCTDSELKKTPQKCRDNCIEFETRAVYQACLLINRIISDNK